MAAGAIRDRFANIAAIEVVESAANTLSFTALATNMGFLGRRDQALAMAIDEIQFRIDNNSLSTIDGEPDSIALALTTSNLVTDLMDLTDRRILDNFEVGAAIIGTAASGYILPLMPIKHQFFPPLITAERTIYLAVVGTSMAAAVTAQCRILFRVETLQAAELIELSEVFRLTG